MRRDESGTRAWGRYLHLGIQLAVTILLCTLLGYWGDTSWGTAPWLTVGGAALGMTAGFTGFIRDVLRAEAEQARDDERERRGD